MEPARVIVPGLVIFGLDAIQGTFYTEIAVDHLGIGSIIGTVLFGASALGLTFYAGMLERLVGSVERGEPAQPVFTVLRTLPWGRLLLAEAILIVVSAVASVALVVPGLIVGTISPWSVHSSTCSTPRCPRRSSGRCSWCGRTSCWSS